LATIRYSHVENAPCARKVGSARQGLKQRLLSSVLGVCPAPEHPQRDSIGSSLVTANKYLESVSVAALRRTDEMDVVNEEDHTGGLLDTTRW